MEQNPSGNHEEIDRLIRIFKEKNEQEITRLYTKYQNEFTQWAKRGWSLEEADFQDVFQDSIIDLYKKAIDDRLVNIRVTVKTYLFAIADNKLKKRHRINARFLPIDGIPENHLGDGDNFKMYQRIEDEHLKYVMKANLANLGDRCYQILVYFFYRDFSIEAITREMGYKNKQVASVQKKKCLDQLKDIFFSKTPKKTNEKI